MKNWKLWLILAIVGIVLLLIGYIIISFRFLDVFVDYWWFSSLGYEGYFIQRLIYRYLIFFGITLIFFLICFSNFYIGSRYLGTCNAPNTGACQIKSYRKWLKLVQSGSLKVYTPISVILGISIAIPLYTEWEKVLLYFFSPQYGALDPVYKNDIGYYLFSYPVYSLIQYKLLTAFGILFIALSLLYYAENRMLRKSEQSLAKGAKAHLTVLVVIILFIQAWGYILQRHELLYTTRHLPIFYGPGFTEMWYYWILIWGTLIAFIGSAITFIVYFHSRKGLKLFVVFIILFLAFTGLGKTKGIPETIEKYFIKPNEKIREKPYIHNCIQATLDAYDLGKIEIKPYPVERTPTTISFEKIRNRLSNIPVWDKELLDDVYSQLQAIRPYYAFPTVDVDRYTVNGKYQQVYLAARELTQENLPSSAQTWTNKRLQYTHGLGAVMTPAVQGGDEPINWYIRDISMKSDDFKIDQPAIYFGTGKYEYVIVPNEEGEIDPRTKNEKSNYDGKAGVPLSLFKKILFSVYFGENDIFFAGRTTSESRLLFRRNIIERVKALTPFFALDSDPYLVIASGKFYWVMDGYTTSNQFPNAEPYNQDFNYIRNSVKIVVDAYDGTTTYYIADDRDPIIRAYQRMYPNLLKPMGDMPESIRNNHLRYPKDYFDIQMRMFARYHQTDPGVFYEQEDSWEFSRFSDYSPSYYLTLNLLNPEKHEFILISPMNPIKFDNLRSLAIAGCDGDNYGRLMIYSFPIEKQIFGPSQISSLIDQDTLIAQELTLWDQVGSEVKRGRLLILPMDDFILYIQPIYLSSSTRLKIPELKRIIASQGDMVAMDNTVEEAVKKLEDKLKTRSDRIQRRTQPTEPEKSHPTTDGHAEQPVAPQSNPPKESHPTEPETHHVEEQPTTPHEPLHHD